MLTALMVQVLGFPNYRNDFSVRQFDALLRSFNTPISNLDRTEGNNNRGPVILESGVAH